MHKECWKRKLKQNATANNRWFLVESGLHLTLEWPWTPSSADYNLMGNGQIITDILKFKLLKTKHIHLLQSNWDLSVDPWHLLFTVSTEILLFLFPCKYIRVEYPSTYGCTVYNWWLFCSHKLKFSILGNLNLKLH